MSSQMSSRRSLCGIVLIGLLILSLTIECQARYLPTRADPSRREQIRELLKALLFFSPSDEARGGGYGSYEYGAGGPGGSLKGLERTD